MPLHALENDPEYLQLQTEMVRMQNWLIEKNQRLIVVVEGRDSAGKGGAIMRFIRFINPRHYRVVALNKPTKAEKGQWYFQRYIKHFPDPGEIVFFDRSWYNRAVVEPVMGFCTTTQYKRFLEQVVDFERMLVDDGLILIKLWFSIDKKEQESRLEERETNPLISWKLSPVDRKAQLKWDEYTEYKQAMFEATSTSKAPWTVISGNKKDRARKDAMRYVLSHIDYDEKGMTGVSLDYDTSVVRVLDSAETAKALNTEEG